MTIIEKINFWQAIFAGITAIGVIIAAILAYKIGRRQIKIINFVEVFLMPQQIQLKKVGSGDVQIGGWSVLIKNISSYPIYLNSYTLNGVKQDIGNTPIPNNSDSWYSVSIPQDVQKNGKLSLVVEFEDYLGKKYKTDGFGKYEEVSWSIHQNQRVEIS